MKRTASTSSSIFAVSSAIVFLSGNVPTVMILFSSGPRCAPHASTEHADHLADLSAGHPLPFDRFPPRSSDDALLSLAKHRVRHARESGHPVITDLLMGRGRANIPSLSVTGSSVFADDDQGAKVCPAQSLRRSARRRRRRARAAAL